jgi:molybdate transport system permease protein
MEWTAIALSLRIALVATIASLPFAILVALLLARREFVGKQVINGLVHLPLVLPPVVTGYLLLVLFGTQGTFGAWLNGFGITLSFRWTGAALAAAVMAFPLMVRAIRLSIEAADRGLEQAAATLGASPLRVFATVTLPLMLPGILAASVLGFAKALGEFGATITFVAAIPGETQTIASAIYGLLQVPGQSPGIAALVTVSIVLAMGALVLSEWLSHRIARRWAA